LFVPGGESGWSARFSLDTQETEIVLARENVGGFVFKILREQPIPIVEDAPALVRLFFGKDTEFYPAMFVIINLVLEPEISPKGALTSVVADRP